MVENIAPAPLAERVAARCIKCKARLDHEVVSRDAEGIIERVRCLTCGGEHKYRKEKAKAPRKVARPRKVDPARDFELLSEAVKGKKPQNYSMSGSFKAGDVIDHNTFGMGIVISAMNKQMEVVFSDHPRILVFNRDKMEISGQS